MLMKVIWEAPEITKTTCGSEDPEAAGKAQEMNVASTRLSSPPTPARSRDDYPLLAELP
jgi:hypothetical protein